MRSCSSPEDEPRLGSRAALPCRIASFLVAAQDGTQRRQAQEHPGLTCSRHRHRPTPNQERMRACLLRGVASEKLSTAPTWSTLFTTASRREEAGRPRPIDSLSVIHLGEHLERPEGPGTCAARHALPLEIAGLWGDRDGVCREGAGKQASRSDAWVSADTRKVGAWTGPSTSKKRSSAATGGPKARRPRPQGARADQGKRPAGRGHHHPAGTACRGRLHVPDVVAEDLTVTRAPGARHWAARAALAARPTPSPWTSASLPGTGAIFQEGHHRVRIERRLPQSFWRRACHEKLNGTPYHDDEPAQSRVLGLTRVPTVARRASEGHPHRVGAARAGRAHSCRVGL